MLDLVYQHNMPRRVAILVYEECEHMLYNRFKDTNWRKQKCSICKTAEVVRYNWMDSWSPYAWLYI